MQNIELSKSFKIYRQTYQNGLRVIVIPVKRIPVVSINLTYRVGSKDENPDNTGFAHLFEHLMFQGTKNVPNGDFDKLCSEAGGTNNAYTSYDHTSYNMLLPSNQLELGLWLESDRMFNFEVSELAFNTQRNVVIEEIKQTVENVPYGRWREVLAKSAYRQDCGYSWEVHGNIEHLNNADLTIANEFFKKYYKPDNACLVIAGDIDLDNSFLLIDKYFNSTEISDKIVSVRKKWNPDNLQFGVHNSLNDDVPYNAVFLSYHSPGFYSDESYSADITASILGNGRSSRIYHSLVYEKQIASSAGAFCDKREDASLVTLYAVANDESISCENLYNAINDEIKLYIKNGLKSDEVVKSKNQLATQYAYELQHISGISDLAATYSIFWDEPEMLFSVLEKYLSKTNDELSEFALKTFIEENSIRVDVRPFT